MEGETTMLETFSRWNPFAEMDGLRREMNRLFDRYPATGTTRRAKYPPTNIWLGQDGVAFTVALPGYDPDDVEINSAHNTLTIRGQRKAGALNAAEEQRTNERHTAEFVRTFELPFNVDPNKTSASFDKGILLISLGRPEEEKPKKIEIKAGK
jgi:HSP20 family protein